MSLDNKTVLIALHEFETTRSVGPMEAFWVLSRRIEDKGFEGSF